MQQNHVWKSLFFFFWGIIEYRFCQWVLVKVGLQLWCVAQTRLLIWVRFTIQTYTCMLVQRISVALNMHVTCTYCLIQSLFAIVGHAYAHTSESIFRSITAIDSCPFRLAWERSFIQWIYTLYCCVYTCTYVCVREKKGESADIVCRTSIVCVGLWVKWGEREREREKPLPWLKLTKTRWWLLSPNLYEEAWGHWVHVLDSWHLLRYFLSVHVCISNVALCVCICVHTWLCACTCYTLSF